MIHCIAALCLAGSLLLLQRTARNLTSPAAALIMLAFAVCWLALLQHDDYLHYSSELVPGLLLAGAAALVTHPDFSRTHWRVILAGLLLGAIPWTKLQAVPIGASLGLWALWQLIRNRSEPGRWAAALSLVVAALFPIVAIVV